MDHNRSSSADDAGFDPRASISCLDAANAIFWCMGPAHQFDRYYKAGAFDSCGARFSELAFCVKLKAASADTAKVMLRQLLRDERTTEGVVWQPRAAPPAPLIGAPLTGAEPTAAGAAAR